MRQNLSRNWIALILAIGLCTAMNVFIVAVLYDAITDPEHAGLSENATQILTGWGGGIVGILGGVFGYEAGRTHAAADHPTPSGEPEEDPGES